MPFLFYFAKLYFDKKHLEKGLKGKGMGGGVGGVYNKKVPFLANIERCPEFLEYTLWFFQIMYQTMSSNISKNEIKIEKYLLFPDTFLQ